MLGCTDPSSHQVWAYPHRKNPGAPSAATSAGMNIQLLLVKPDKSSAIYKSDVLSYNWQDWDMPNYHERYKESYYILQSYMAAAGDSAG